LPAFSSSMWTIYHHFPVNKGYKTTGQALHPLGVRFACLPAGRLTLSRPKGRVLNLIGQVTPFGYVRKHLSKGLSVLLRVAPQPYRFCPLIGSFALLRFTKALNEFFGAHEIAPQPYRFCTPFGYVRKHLSKGLSVLMKSHLNPLFRLRTTGVLLVP